MLLSPHQETQVLFELVQMVWRLLRTELRAAEQTSFDVSSKPLNNSDDEIQVLNPCPAEISRPNHGFQLFESSPDSGQ
jgi:hypothetical protein